jgi:hypothetical protein
MVCNRVADSHRLNADPDPTSHFGADPDHVLHQSDANLRPPSHIPSRPPFGASTPTFWASTALHGFIVSLKSSWIFLLMRIRLFTLMRIRIQLPKTMRIHADPYPIPWFATGTGTYLHGYLENTKLKASLYLDKVLETPVPGLTLGLWERHHWQRPQVELQAIAYHKTLSHLQEKINDKNQRFRFRTGSGFYFNQVSGSVSGSGIRIQECKNDPQK